MQKNAPKGDTLQINKGKRSLYWQVAVICLAILGLYSSITNDNYVDLDDTTVIVNNYPFLKDFSNIPQAFKQGVFQEYGKQDTLKTYYRPLMTVSFMIDAHLSPAKDMNFISPKPFLRGNIFYHMVACILLLLLLNALNFNPAASFLLTLLFAVHPLLTQAVAWIPGRNDPLVAIFALSSMLLLLKYVNTKKALHLFLHLLFFTLALFTKENAVMLIAITFLYTLFVRKGQATWKENLSLAIGYAIVISWWYTMRQKTIAGSGPDIGLAEAFKNILTNSPMFFQYIGKALLPFNLSVMSTVQDTNYIQGIMVILILGAGIFLSKQKNIRYVIFGIVWFFIFLTPSFVTMFGGLEHRAYLPMVGLLIVLSEFDTVKKTEFKFSPLNTGIVSIVVLILIFGGITYSRLPIFKNCFTFDESAMKTSPKNVLPCLYLASHYEQTQQYERALDTYNEALRRDSTAPLIHNNIAGEYIVLHKYPEAEAELRKEISLHPDDKFAVFNLGLIAYSYGRDSVALADWKQALKLDPGFMNPHKMLAEYYMRKDDSVNAEPYKKWLRDKGYPEPTLQQGQ